MPAMTASNSKAILLQVRSTVGWGGGGANAARRAYPTPVLAGFRLGDLALLGIGCDVGPYLVMGTLGGIFQHW